MTQVGTGDATLQRAKVATAIAFGLNGFAFASWLARVPAVRTGLGLSTSSLGLLLLCLSGGAVLALVFSGVVVNALGAARTVLGGAVLVAVGLAGLSLAVAAGSVAGAGVFLFLMGLGTSPWDVAMNVEGAVVERRLERIVMPRFHAGFSLGTVAGAGVGALCAVAGIAVGTQLLVTGCLAVAVVSVAVRSFLPATDTADTHPPATDVLGARPATVAAGIPADEPAGAPAARPGAGSVLQAWFDRRTVAIGFFVLAFALTEGVANDWLAVAFVDGYGVAGWAGALGFGVFVSAMTVGRLFGDKVLTRYGRVSTLRGSAVVALTGLLLVVFGGYLPVVVVGTALWGLGASLGFPLGMSAAAEDPERAAGRVSVVASIGYTAFLAGPPVIGILADTVGILRALLVVGFALVIGYALASSTRESAAADR